MTFTKNKSWADTQTIEDNADTGNIGKDVLVLESDLDDVTIAKFFSGINPLNTPFAGSVSGLGLVGQNPNNSAQIAIMHEVNRAYFRSRSGNVFSDWAELHTSLAENNSIGTFSATGATRGSRETSVGSRQSSVDVTPSAQHLSFYNPNGGVGSINTSGSSTQYNTSSDPRLKDFKEAPSDEAINNKFNDLFDAFAVFNWKSDPEGDLVWGFDAHKAIDNKLDMGSEGEGSRDLELGEVYDTIPAEYEERAILDDDGNETGETETIEVKPEQELKVSPAGVDQSKAVPILLAKIEQLERRVKMLESK